MVAKLIDSYLEGVAPDVNLKLGKFVSLAEVVPEYARPLDDGMKLAVGFPHWQCQEPGEEPLPNYRKQKRSSKIRFSGTTIRVLPTTVKKPLFKEAKK
ncbi:phototropic-responsive NPH3 family protein [Artemisia annua]|uniref:Phototropic-responsive NPH3 family protein n=1 Tax=Artemisia annua TaxID=35608 RepID=A0A2U1NQ98_ARTAN|nr:phototropic-responsive NPH3 family protein [Artemisia annua]